MTLFVESISMCSLSLLPEIWFPQPLCIAGGDQSIPHRCHPEAAMSQRGAVSYNLFLLRMNRGNHWKQYMTQTKRVFAWRVEAPQWRALEELHPSENWQKTYPVSRREAGAKHICSLKERRVEDQLVEEVLCCGHRECSSKHRGRHFLKHSSFQILFSLFTVHPLVIHCYPDLVLISSHLTLTWSKTMLCHLGVHSSVSDLMIWRPITTITGKLLTGEQDTECLGIEAGG